MSKKYAILPCNGLDRRAGVLTREIAVQLAEKTGSEVICPVLYRVADTRYNKTAREMPLLILDGCATRCATRLAAEKGLKIADRLSVTDFAKEENIALGSGLSLDAQARELVDRAIAKLLNATDAIESNQESHQKRDKSNAAVEDNQSNTSDEFFPPCLTYESYQKGKFIFRLPADEGFYFNENDVWAYVSGNRARIGVTDYAQKSLSDILYFAPPAVGAEIAQFDEAGVIESGKAVFEIISPVSGVVTSVNEKLISAPETLNQSPYEQGWVAEIELSDFAQDSELLHTFDGYMPIMKRKVDEYRVKN